MNAITDLQGTDAVLEHIPVTSMRPSDTHIQTLRRKHFNAEKLLELAGSIRENGVLQPILVRPITPKGTVKFEVVAGERRWIAADRAGLAHVPCIVRPLTPTQVLEAQLVENLQREGLHALEEAEGYKELIELTKAKPEDIGDKIGKSRSYVYARLKLLDLIPAAREALAAGTLDASRALLIARLGEKEQTAAFRIATESHGGEPIYSLRSLVSKLRQTHMVQLNAAPFDLGDAELTLPEKTKDGRDATTALVLPACFECPKFSGNDAELRAQFTDGADVCTDRSCYDAKVACLGRRRRTEAEAKGTPVLDGEDAKKIIPGKDKLVGYIDLDAVCEFDEYPHQEPEPGKDEDHETPAYVARLDAFYAAQDNWISRTYRQLLGDAKIDTVLVQDPKTKQVRALVNIKQARQILEKQAKVELPSYLGKPEPKRTPQPKYDYEKARLEREAREEKEKVWRTAVIKAISEKCAGPIRREELADIADELTDHQNKEALKVAFGGKIPEPSSLKDAELGRYIRIASLGNTMNAWQAPTALLAAAKQYKVDVNKIKKQITDAEKAAAKAKDKPASTQPQPVAAAKKKPAAKAKKKGVKK